MTSEPRAWLRVFERDWFYMDHAATYRRGVIRTPMKNDLKARNVTREYVVSRRQNIRYHYIKDHYVDGLCKGVS